MNPSISFCWTVYGILQKGWHWLLSCTSGQFILFLLSILIFNVSYSISTSHDLVWVVVRVISGTTGILFLPGAFITHRLLPRSVENIVTYCIIGLLSGIICIQFEVFTFILLGITMPLNVWLTLLNLFIVVGCYLDLRRIASQGDFGLRAGINRTVLIVMGLAFCLRVCLAVTALNSISPDATLYSDFARGILNGLFQPNILNDDLILYTESGLAHAVHRGFVYVVAISFLLIEPVTSGPSYILIIIGTCLVGIVAQISQFLFDDNAALWTSIIVAIHPLFIFYSAVAYGPEIFSLVLLLLSLQIILNNKSTTWPIAGVIIGCIDAVWLPNYYIALLIIPLLLRVCRFVNDEQTLSLMTITIMAILSRQVLNSMSMYILIWSAIMAIIFLTQFTTSYRLSMGHAILLISIVFTEVYWQSPILLTNAAEGMSSTEANPLVAAIFASVSIRLVMSFIFFLIFHTTVTIISLIIIAVTLRQFRMRAIQLLLIDAIVTAGTLKVFSVFTKDVLLVEYLYTDGRFFLVIVLITILISGAILSAKVPIGKAARFISNMGRQLRHYHRPIVMFVLLFVSMLPGYVMIPTGVGYVDIENRYGWREIKTVVGTYNYEDSIFLLDRAKEFSWHTGHRSVALMLNSSNIPDVCALMQMLESVQRFKVTHMIIDRYTIAHWQTLNYLYGENMPIGTISPLNVSAFLRPNPPHTVTLEAISLVNTTEHLNNATYFRLFSLQRGNFSVIAEIDLLSPGWTTGGTGQISNRNGTPAIEVGSNEGMTFTYRHLYDLNISLSGGILVLDLEEVGARVERVEVWDTCGRIIRNTPYSGGVFACPFGEVSIGDVRIIVVGESGGYVLVRSAVVWGAQFSD